MLVERLKNTCRPINYGEFTPRLEGKSGRRSASANAHRHGLSGSRPSSTGTGGPAAATFASLRSGTCDGKSGASSALGRVSDGMTPRDRSDQGTPQQAASSARATPSKTFRYHKVFSNSNSYEGNMIDGRMHGDGIYIWSDGAKYEGQFREGYMWGEGEKTWPNGRTYQGEWVRDMMWGDGEMSWPSGETFRGQFRKGIFHGRGTRVWPSGDWYAGEFTNGEQEGEGTFESAAEGWVYNGRWLHGRMFGEGRAEWPNKVQYIGEWKDGIREGKGQLRWPDGARYDGQFRRNCIEGRGRKALPDGSWFEGHFHGGELTGTGTFHWADGTEFEGWWHNSEIVGPGCHRFPDDTTITGVFEDRGASGEGTKKWANGCVYTGMLLRNQIQTGGSFQWPDGRRYVGHFQDETMHGEGTLTWSDKDGVCRYKGRFEGNVFHGEGVLEWSNKAKYKGEFRNGLYHGDGTFEWPDRNAFRGQWEFGEMCGRGVLASAGQGAGAGDAFVYVGDFFQGHMEGNGRVTFPVASGPQKELRDSYRGELRRSMFHGLGTFTWASGHSLSGCFRENLCCQFGCKLYPSGQVYYGGLEEDLEHGKGVLMEGETRLIGVWEKGRLVEELFETYVPALELDAIEGEEWQKVFGGLREAQASTKKLSGLPEVDEHGELVEGEAIVLYLSGDKYVGHVKGGKKNGLGMYVYADLTAYKGHWCDDVLDGERHPRPMQERSEQVLKLHTLNQSNQSLVEALQKFANPEAEGSVTNITKSSKVGSRRAKPS